MSTSRRQSSQTPSSTVNLYCSQCQSQIGIFDNDWIRLTTSYARPQSKGTHFGTEVGKRTQIVPDGYVQSAAAGCEMAEVFCKTCSAGVGQYCKGSRDVEKRYLIDQYFYKISRTFLKDARTFSKTEHIFGDSEDTSRQRPQVSTAPRAVAKARAGSARTESLGRKSVSRHLAPPGGVIRRQSSLSQVSRYSESDDVMESDNAQEDDEADDMATIVLQQGEKLASQQELLEKQSAILSKHSTQLSEFKSLFEKVSTQTKDQSSTSSRLLERSQILEQSMEKLQKSIRGLISESASPSDSTPETTKSTDSDELGALRAENRALKLRLDALQANKSGGKNISQPGLYSKDHDLVLESPSIATSVLGKRKRGGRQDTSDAQNEPEMIFTNEGLPQMPTPRSIVPPNISAQSSPRAATPDGNGQEIDTQMSQDSPIYDNDVTASVTAHGEYFGSYSKSVTRSSTRAKQLANSTTSSSGRDAESGLRAVSMEAANNEDRRKVVASTPVAVFRTEPSQSDQNLPSSQNLDGTIETKVEVQSPLPRLPIPNAVSPKASIPTNTTETGNTIVTDGPALGEDNLDPLLRSGPAPIAANSKIGNEVDHSQTSRQSSTSLQNDEDVMSDYDTSTTSSPLSSARHDSRRGTVGPDQGARSMAPEPAKRRKNIHPDGIKVIDLDNARVSTPMTIAQKMQRKGLPREKKRRVQTTEKNLNKELEKLGLTEWIGKNKTDPAYRRAVSAARARAREQAKQEALMALNAPPPSDPIATPPKVVDVPEPVVQPSKPPPAPAVAPAAPVALTLMYPQGVPLCSPMSFRPVGSSPSAFMARAPVFNPLSAESEDAIKTKEKPAPDSPAEQKKKRLAKIRERDRLAKEAMDKEEW